MNQIDHVIVLAGGAGTRLWPASRRALPKQFMDPGTGAVLIDSTLRRAAALEPARAIVVVTHCDHVPQLLVAVERLPDDIRQRLVVLSEPHARNTAAAIAFAIGYLRHDEGSTGDAMTSLVIPADHVVEPVAAYRDDVVNAAALAREGFIVTFGIAPAGPDTGYGYIETGAAHGPGHLVASFREKPDLETARRYVADGRYLWNSGMFLFEHRVLLEELARHAPRIHEALASEPLPLDRTHEGPVPVFTPADADAYAALPAISIDYAVMERASNAAVVRAGFAWSDVGSWDEVAALSERGSQTDGAPRCVSIDSRRNYVRSDLPVALCGVEDLIVVVENGTVLVCRRGKSQLVRDAVQAFGAEGLDEAL
jgi:mannose-1-phosphate guanylyltransferase / mannose-6-phosphate isomerase